MSSYWIMEVKVGGKFVSVRCTGATEPYRYNTQKEAERMLDICYPLLIRGEEARTREVVEK